MLNFFVTGSTSGDAANAHQKSLWTRSLPFDSLYTIRCQRAGLEKKCGKKEKRTPWEWLILKTFAFLVIQFFATVTNS